MGRVTKEATKKLQKQPKNQMARQSLYHRTYEQDRPNKHKDKNTKTKMHLENIWK